MNTHDMEREGAEQFKEYFNKTEGMLTFNEACLLYSFASKITSGCIVEIGSYRGRSTVALGRGSLDGNKIAVYAIEPHEVFVGLQGGQFGPQDRGAFYKAMLDTQCFEIVRLINLSSEMVAPQWKTPVSLLWIDGDHSYDAVLRDFTCWEKRLSDQSVVIFHDSISPKLGPKRLIQELIANKGYTIIKIVEHATVLMTPRP